MQNTANWLFSSFFEIAISSFFWSGPLLSEEADANYRKVGVSFEIVILLFYIPMKHPSLKNSKPAEPRTSKDIDGTLKLSITR